MNFNLSALILAFAVALVEGFEASTIVATEGRHLGWSRTAAVALVGLLTASAVGTGIYFLYGVVNGKYIDYGVSAVIFLIGVNELREGLLEHRTVDKSGESQKSEGKRSGWAAAGPIYLGVTLESVEVIIYTIAVGHSTAGGYASAIIGGAAGFILPWLGVAYFVRWAKQIPEWKQEVAVGIILMIAAALFGTLEATGIL